MFREFVILPPQAIYEMELRHLQLSLRLPKSRSKRSLICNVYKMEISKAHFETCTEMLHTNPLFVIILQSVSIQSKRI